MVGRVVAIPTRYSTKIRRRLMDVAMSYDCHNRSEFGLKVLQLNEMIDIGLNVPVFCALGDGSMKEAVGYDRLKRWNSKILEEANIREVSQHIQHELITMDIDFDHVITKIKLHTSFFDGSTTYAVRSSGLEEDGEATSFAGAHDSYLNVPIDDLGDAIKRCWASLYNYRALSYRRELGLGYPQGMGVIIQKMVNADIAGVAFSSDPTGSIPGSMIIEVVKGCGDSLVGGTKTPTTVFVSKGSGKLLLEIRGDDDIHTPPDVLTRLRLGMLAAEGHKGVPVDMEWVFSEKRHLYFLQVRRITKMGMEGSVNSNRKGMGASPGIVEGYGRWVNDEYSIIEPGDILLTRQTNPLFLPLMKKAGGVITAKGGITCHAAIVCRELNIPCIVGVGEGIHNLIGKVVTMNGSSGEAVIQDE